MKIEDFIAEAEGGSMDQVCIALNNGIATMSAQPGVVQVQVLSVSHMTYAHPITHTPVFSALMACRIMHAAPVVGPPPEGAESASPEA